MRAQRGFRAGEGMLGRVRILGGHRLARAIEIGLHPVAQREIDGDPVRSATIRLVQGKAPRARPLEERAAGAFTRVSFGSRLLPGRCRKPDDGRRVHFPI